MSLLITNVHLEQKNVSILIEDKKIISIYPSAREPENITADKKLDAGGKIAVPSFKNGHTHAAMTLLRGYADDIKLQPWLEEKIWPAEALMTPEDIYWGTRLAALEMIKTGTTFCNDMYFHFPEAWQAFRDAGIKASIGAAILDQMDAKTARTVIENTKRTFREFSGLDEKLIFSPAPHAIYTVSESTLRWVADFSRDNNLIVHIHLSETEQEVKDCITAHGMRPVEYLDSIGFLCPRIAAAHAVWLSEKEMDILSAHQVTVVHNPVSNMKLASGGCFQFDALHKRNVPMMLGTDGCSSNNNLDMCEEMKIAALLQKHHFGDPERMKAEEIFSIAIGGRTSLYPIFSSRIEAGAYADLLLIDPKHSKMVPDHNIISNLIYSGGESSIDTVICNGEILMRNRVAADEDIVIEQARGRAAALRKRTQTA